MHRCKINILCKRYVNLWPFLSFHKFARILRTGKDAPLANVLVRIKGKTDLLINRNFSLYELFLLLSAKLLSSS